MLPLHDNIQSRTVPVVNYLLIAINLAFFVFELSLGSAGLESFIAEHALNPARFLWGLSNQPANLTLTGLPMLVSMFLHGGWSHILGNMLYLYIFGDNVEDRFGHFAYIGFYLVAGAAASLAHVLASPGSQVPTIGASGAVAGVMGAYLLLYPKARVETLIFLFVFVQLVEVPAVAFLFFWFVIQFFQGALSITQTFHGDAAGGGVAWWAHIGGFAAGVALAWSKRSRMFRRG